MLCQCTKILAVINLFMLSSEKKDLFEWNHKNAFLQEKKSGNGLSKAANSIRINILFEKL
jgi:hypothetical protein